MKLYVKSSSDIDTTIDFVTKMQNDSNEDGATLSIWYYVTYKNGRRRYFKHLPKSAEKFMKSAHEAFWSVLTPKSYEDSDGVKRGMVGETCDYGYTQYETRYEQ